MTKLEDILTSAIGLDIHRDTVVACLLKGAKRATIALARKLLTVIYHMLKNDEPYAEERYEQRRQQCERKRANRMIHELEKLGYQVSPASA